MSDSQYQSRKAFFDRVVTVYGRKAVLEALQDPNLECHALHLAESNRESGIIREILDAAQARGIAIERHDRAALARLSKNGKQDQGVAADILCPEFQRLEDYLGALPAHPQHLLALDGITNPQNLGMILRSATAGAIDGIIWTPKGNASLGPLVIKASTGTLYRAPLLKAGDLPAALRDCQQRGFEVCTLDANADASLFDARPQQHRIFVLGNESSGVSAEVANIANAKLSIPMARGVESLNVAVTASLIAYHRLLS